MARTPRRPIDNGIYHVLNRGNCGMNIFEKPGDFQSFIKLLEQGRQHYSMRILGYCLMNNHWHLVLRPRRRHDLSSFVGWCSTTHVRRWREHRGNSGEGHLYQGRYKCFLVQDDSHFLNVMRYVEGNPLRAGMVQRAQDWPWSSLGGAPGSDQIKVQIASWPVDKPSRWTDRVNQLQDDKTIENIRLSLSRNRPFGDEKWTARVVKRHGLESSMRNPWRPGKMKP